MKRITRSSAVRNDTARGLREGIGDSAQHTHFPERRGLCRVDSHKHPSAARKGLPVAEIDLCLLFCLFEFRFVFEKSLPHDLIERPGKVSVGEGSEQPVFVQERLLNFLESF